MDVALLAWVPRALDRFDDVHHRVCVALDFSVRDSRLDEPPLALVEVAFARQQPFPEDPLRLDKSAGGRL
jgi:hypothetical protein